MQKKTTRKVLVELGEIFDDIIAVSFVKDIQQMELYAQIDELNERRAVNDAVNDIAPVF